MKKISESLISELEAQLKFIHAESNDPLEYSERAIKILVVVLEKLKGFVIKNSFENKMDEIIFFKDIKPQFAAQLIYYNEVYNIVTNKPFGSKKIFRKYYASELKKLNFYFEENTEFYKYYRTGSQYLDNRYFIRGRHDLRLSLDSFYLQADRRFSTSHDFKVAKILANDRLKTYLEAELETLNRNVAAAPVKQNNMKWTGSKVALTELIYALHAEAVFNNGNTELKETVRFFEEMFNIELGQFNRTFLEIRDRKSDRTKFLNALTNKLVLRMDDADEN